MAGITVLHTAAIAASTSTASRRGRPPRAALMTLLRTALRTELPPGLTFRAAPPRGHGARRSWLPSRVVGRRGGGCRATCVTDHVAAGPGRAPALLPPGQLAGAAAPDHPQHQ